MNKLNDAIAHMRPCEEAVEWLETQSTRKEAWQNCERGDWMLWLLGHLAGEPWSDERKPHVLAACACARQSLPNVPQGELRPLRAIETAESWARGEGATPEEVSAAWSAAESAAWSAAGLAAESVAESAAETVAETVARSAARSESLKQSADIIRQYFPRPPKLKEIRNAT